MAVQDAHLISQAHPKSQHDPADNEHGQALCARLQRRSYDEQQAPNCHGPPPTQGPARDASS